jgi:beta-glucanase (GH16 family)
LERPRCKARPFLFLGEPIGMGPRLERRFPGCDNPQAMPRHSPISLLAGALLASLLSAGAAPAQEPQSGPFVDRFGVVDERRWRISDGWANPDGTANDWRRSQVFRNDRGLSLVFARHRGGGAHEFTSGEIQSRDSYLYGYFEVRMRVPRESGLVAGFFTFARPEGRESWDEIDIEILGRNPRHVEFGYFSDGERRAIRLPLGFDAAARMHTYGFEWTSAHIRWYVDGRLRHEDRTAIPQSPQQLMLNMGHNNALTHWHGPIPRWRRGPWTLRVSCIAYAERYPGRPICG